ncbi:MAG: hypothetical protein PHH54_05750 [Candidatus Nanoarchaeia archaeon]|nr:hypothetical protein [Candidatus Nanoarchaeia archaeon]MDD5741459.1 hypothetical protein [Candidatus Nanoarchaeia archaeon]
MTETAILDEIEQQTRVKSNLYKVPIWEISHMPCLEGSIQGECARSYLSEGENSIEAALKLTESPSYWKNYNKLSVEQKRFLKPFKLRFDKEIEKIPNCENRHMTEEGDYVCGVPSTEGEPDIHGINGDFGDCMCQSFWTHDIEELREHCPYRKILR